MATRGFFGGRRPEPPRELPPGQYYEKDFPVLTAGPAPRVDTAEWELTLSHGDNQLANWSWDQFLALPQEEVTRDIHCVTRWSKLDALWKGVSVDVLFEAIGTPPEDYVMAYCYGDYTTNLAMADITGGKAWIAWEFEGERLQPEHGGPARLVIPHLYFWKSAKWIKDFRFMSKDAPGFWEAAGYHMRGDPWNEERYWGD